MKISVITVSYNAAATIADTIASVQAQDHPDIEHVIIDGNSKDGTQAIVAQMANARTIFVSEPDRGLYDAMNKGVARASGDVIGILNADDFLADPAVLSRIARPFTEDPSLDAVIGDIAFLASGLRFGRRYDSGRFHPNRIGWGWMPAHPGMYLTRQAYDLVGEYRTDYQIAADFEFIVRAFAKARLRYRYIPDVFVHMRPGGVSTAGLRAKWTINREMLRACRAHGVRTSWPMILSKYFFKTLEYMKK
ncbi:glycosyltransferase [Sphingomonas sp. MMSM20]|uniref:glycosyltransferase family 2 protein n=1 Tax=Sphingomonas lycopersici TaxID=2951807 RepID=UPI0022370137|nr:glycosyltransferase family 2 protein [Sphingomonas lycopersici]MCW6531209.1 glycosyltransferase [Sphingomonas lycopersici]